MTSGSRPPFGVDGYWLYLGDQAVVHLIDNPAGLAPASASRATTRIDHVALRVESPAEWRALHGRLRENGVPFSEAEVPVSGERQLFVALAPNVVIEFVTAL